MIITVDDLKRHLYIDFTADDLILAEMIETAERLVEQYLNRPYSELIEIFGEVPSPVISAVKIMAANLYNNRESVTFNAVPYRVPYSFEYLLQPYKKYLREDNTERSK